MVGFVNNAELFVLDQVIISTSEFTRAWRKRHSRRLVHECLAHMKTANFRDVIDKDFTFYRQNQFSEWDEWYTDALHAMFGDEFPPIMMMFRRVM